MAKSNNNIDQGDVLVAWSVPEFEKHERSRHWYIIAAVLAVMVLVYAFFASNFLFAIIIVLGAIIVILNDAREPEMVNFAITDEGLTIGKRFVDYDDLRDFSIIYKPKAGVKKMYFEFKNIFRPRLSIYLDDMNPLKIRDILLHYLKEDLERENEPLSESLARLFKI